MLFQPGVRAQRCDIVADAEQDHAPLSVAPTCTLRMLLAAATADRP